jgi:hypothetical protein
MSRKNRKNTPLKNWLKDLLNGCLRLTIVITIFLSGNDYQITTVIQLKASHYEVSNHRLVVENQSTYLQTTNFQRPDVISPLSCVT